MRQGWDNSFGFLSFVIREVIFNLFYYLIQDKALSKYFKYFLEHQSDVATERQEKELMARVTGLQSAASEPLVQFLYPVLNGLFSLLVRHSFSKEVTLVQRSGFATLADITKRIQTQLDLPCDKHGHNILLASYLQHVLVAAVGQGSSKDRRATTFGDHDSNKFEKENVRRPTSMKFPIETGIHVVKSFLNISRLLLL